jgi:hypothetical protein
MTKDAHPNPFSGDEHPGTGHPGTAGDDTAADPYGAEHAPDETAPDIVVRGAEKDEADAEERRRRDT